jgi:phage tail sheath protein FI
MAELARSQGAWIAPANQAFADCAGVDPLFAPQDRLALQEARINALTPIVRGFAAGDAMTLSSEPEWGQLNVRRLMIFLRLVALRRGEPLVFESNGDILRRALERDFSQMLGEMQRRGAFVGGKQGWRLAIQNSQADRDNGRIVAEIGVAPSQPLRFLTFRLVQQGARLTLAEAA